jgi:drug/metabolite transporter (DMT)-like permease
VTSPDTVALVLASTVAHAYWNFLVRRSGGGQAFVGLSKVAEAVVFAPAFVVWALPGLRGHLDAWPLVVVGALLTLANYVALARAYRSGELSVVYPVARGGTLLFLPPLGFLAFGERVSAVGWAAIACIVAGIGALQLPALSRAAVAALGPRLRDPAVAFALLAALATAGYTTWDKRAVRTLPAFAYFYAYTALVAAAYAAYLWRRYPRAVLRAEWRAHRSPILQVAVCNTGAYLLVLLALRTGTSSYVIALRQLSIAIGALLGWRVLGEEFGPPRRLGVALLVLGCVLVALAR